MPSRTWSEERAELAAAIGANIRTVREERGLSLRYLALVVDIGSNAIWNIETGRSLPDTETLMRVAAVLDCKVEQLLPTDYRERLAPPPAVVDFLRRRAELPAAAAEGSRGTGQPSRRSSSRTTAADKAADRLLAQVESGKRKSSKRTSSGR